MPFLLASTVKEITESYKDWQTSGALSMGRKYKTSSQENGPVLIEYLKYSNTISSKVFALYFKTTAPVEDVDYHPTLEFGGLLQKKTRNNALSDFTWYSQTVNKLWTVKVSGHILGATTEFDIPAKAQYTGPLTAVVNASSPVVLVPKYFWDTYLSTQLDLTGTLGCSKSTHGYYMCSCSSTIPDLQLYIDSKYYQIPGSRFLITNSSSTEFASKQCRLALESHTTTLQWSLGLPFLTNYYAVFDSDNARLGLAPMLDSSAIITTGVSQPTTSDVQTPSTDSGSGGSSVSFLTGVLSLVKVVAVVSVFSGAVAGMMFLLQVLGVKGGNPMYKEIIEAKMQRIEEVDFI